MRTILILSFCFFSMAANAQDIAGLNKYAYVNGIRIDSIDAKYAQTDAIFPHDFSVRFQYGQGTSKKEELVTAEDGTPIKFRSAADLLNFLDQNGWELVPGGGGSSTNISFIFRKKK